MWQERKNDVESGNRQLYPTMLESPELRWAFIRKIYSILAFQLLLTVAVASVIVFVRPIAVFFVTTTADLILYASGSSRHRRPSFSPPITRDHSRHSTLEDPDAILYIVLLITPLIALCPLYYYHQKHPLNFFLLALFTITLAFGVGLSCAFTKGRIILEAAILTTVVVVSLTLYTFWAAKRGHDFNFLGPFLFGALLVLMVFALIQILFPLGKISVMIYGGLAALIFCGYIVYDTDNLIKRYSYDEYIWASVSLYLDVINLFLALLTILRAADG